MNIKAVLDLRDLTPQEATVRIAEAIEDLKKGEIIEAICSKSFENLLSKLEEAEYRYEVGEIKEFYVLRIWHTANVKGRIRVEEHQEKGEFEINENTNVGKLIERYPKAVDILAKYGFTPLKNPILRKTLAKTITLGQAKRIGHLSDERFQELLKELKELKEEKNS